ncbi:hypothetical protein [Portibacter lacus]|uniref:Curlin associated repeat-containing protein n=1 Tax=Portibacter lacus TaxID=1099794 RepID=A0AA37WI13_9BACT|nr:hypothetical protein [Portibacter lacus]GLR19155.1 hypothetical protein GCM10007940_37710 [Portibacter lacus]
MKYLLLLFLVFISHMANSQVVIQNDQGEIKSNLDLFEERNFVERQVVSLSINEGSNNLISFKQVGVNEANARVKGDFNQLFITQNGLENSIDILQEGGHNYMESTNFSSSTKVANIQIGNNNYLDQNFIKADDSNFIVIQNGNNLRLNHNVQGISDSGLEVKMYGRDMEIIIETKQ